MRELPFQLMACPKIVQENIGRPTEIRIGLVLFRRSEIFGLRFTPLLIQISKTYVSYAASEQSHSAAGILGT